MPDNYQLSTQIDDLYRRLAALEAQVSALSGRLGVPFTPATSVAGFDPRLDPAFDPMLAPVPPPAPDPMLAPVPPPAPDPSFGAPASAWAVSEPSADPLGAGLTPEIIDLVRRGKKIQAIKLYRGLTGLGLKEAKNVIDHL